MPKNAFFSAQNVLDPLYHFISNQTRQNRTRVGGSLEKTEQPILLYQLLNWYKESGLSFFDFFTLWFLYGYWTDSVKKGAKRSQTLKIELLAFKSGITHF